MPLNMHRGINASMDILKPELLSVEADHVAWQYLLVSSQSQKLLLYKSFYVCIHFHTIRLVVFEELQKRPQGPVLCMHHILLIVIDT